MSRASPTISSAHLAVCHIRVGTAQLVKGLPGFQFPANKGFPLPSWPCHGSHTLSHWPLTADGQVWPLASPCRICGAQSGTVTGLCPFTSLLCSKCHSKKARHSAIHLLLTLKILATYSIIKQTLLIFFPLYHHICPVCSTAGHKANQWVSSLKNVFSSAK
jgi:hypothetical protein